MRRVAVAVSILILLLVVGCSRRAELSSGDKGFTADIRFINAVPGGSPMSMYLDKDSIVPAIEYNGFSAYRKVVAGKRVIRVFAGGNTDSAVITSDQELESGNHYTAVATGSGDSLKLLFLTDDVSLTPKGKARVRFIDAVPDAYVQSVDLRETPGDKTLVKGVKYLVVGPYITVKAGKHSLELHFEGLSTVIGRAPNAEFKAGGVYTVIAEGRLFENITLEAYEDR